MDLDLFFRLAALAAFATGVTISGIYRARADREGGPLPPPPPDQPSVAFRLVAGLVIWGTLLLSLAIPSRVPWLIVFLPVPVRWAGLACGLAAVPLLWWVMRSIGSNVSPSTATRSGARLVTHGPYRYVRHPLYSVGTLMFLGLGIAVQSLGMLLIVGAFVLWLPWRARQEESHLIESYGDEYRSYMRTAGRFVPRWH